MMKVNFYLLAISSAESEKGENLIFQNVILDNAKLPTQHFFNKKVHKF